MLQKYLSRIYPGILSSVVVMAILWLTLAPHPLPESEMTLFEHADKIVHGVMFGGLVFSLVFDRELYRQRRYEQTGMLPRRHLPSLLLIAVFSLIFGAAVEMLQGWMAMGRGCDSWDFLADLAGVALSAVISPRLVSFLFHRH